MKQKAIILSIILVLFAFSAAAVSADGWGGTGGTTTQPPVYYQQQPNNQQSPWNFYPLPNQPQQQQQPQQQTQPYYYTQPYYQQPYPTPQPYYQQPYENQQPYYQQPYQNQQPYYQQPYTDPQPYYWCNPYPCEPAPVYPQYPDNSYNYGPSGYQNGNVEISEQWRKNGTIDLTWTIRNVTGESWPRTNIDIKCISGCHLLTKNQRLWDIPYTVNRNEKLSFTVNIRAGYGDKMTFAMVAGSKTLYTFDVYP